MAVHQFPVTGRDLPDWMTERRDGLDGRDGPDDGEGEWCANDAKFILAFDFGQESRIHCQAASIIGRGWQFP